MSFSSYCVRVLTLGPRGTDILEHGRELRDVDQFLGFGRIELERLDAVDIVEVQNWERY
jgi:hypothetical protein